MNCFIPNGKFSEESPTSVKNFPGPRLEGVEKTAAMREFSPEAKGERREGRAARNFRQEIYLRPNPSGREKIQQPPIAQLVEQLALNETVAGSNPAGGTKQNSKST